MKISELLKNKKFWLCMLVILIIVILILWMTSRKTENLTTTFDTESDITETPIVPMMHDPETGVIMSGSETNEQNLLAPWYKAYISQMNNHYLLDDGAGKSMGLQYDKCSKSCCSSQYPVPFDLGDATVCKDKSKYVSNTYTCNNQWQDSGCVCMTKKQADFIANRGGNSV